MRRIFGKILNDLANKDKKIVGGSFVLVSKEILEIFMIATEKEFIDKGINYLLAYNMYIFSEKKKIVTTCYISVLFPIHLVLKIEGRHFENQQEILKLK